MTDNFDPMGLTGIGWMLACVFSDALRIIRRSARGVFSSNN
jgi:hypothetical protein